MYKGKGRKWLAILMAAILALPLLPLQNDFVFAEEQAEASVSAPAAADPAPKVESVQEAAPKQEASEAAAPASKADEGLSEERQEVSVEDIEPEPQVTEAPKDPEKQEPTPSPTPTPEPEMTEVPVEPEAAPDISATENPAQPQATTAPEGTLAPEGSIAPETTPDPNAALDPDAALDPNVSPEASLEPTPAPEHFKMLSRSEAYENNHLGSLSIPENGMPIPLIYQYNFGRDVCEIDGDGKSVASSGCGAAAASMIIAYMAQDYDQTPYTLFYWAARNGRYGGDGLDYQTIRDMLSRHGVDSRVMGVSSGNIISALQENRPIIINMGPGTFTDGGHYIVLRGLDEEDKVLVNDPNSSGRSRGAYSAELIAGQAKRAEMLVIYGSPAEAAETPVPEEPHEAAIPALDEAVEPVEEDPVAIDEEAKPEPTEPDEDAPVQVTEPVAQDVQLEPQASELPEATEAPAGVGMNEAMPQWARVNVECVNLRDNPGQKGEICAVAAMGMVLRVVEERIMNSGAIWYGVEYGGQILYLRADMLVPADGPETGIAAEDDGFAGEYTAEVIRDQVNLRLESGLLGQIDATVPLGTLVQVTGEERNAQDGWVWCRVVHEGRTLYVRSDMIAPKP